MIKNSTINRIADELGIGVDQAKAAKSLLEKDNTIPFIARYRKEKTNSLDEVVLRELEEKIDKAKKLQERKETIINTLQQQGDLTPDLERSIKNTNSLSTLEDIYLPHKPKRETRASQARDKGLEHLAEIILHQRPGVDPEVVARDFVSTEKGVGSREEALSGARDIIAETISEDKRVRERLRLLFRTEAILRAERKGNDEGSESRFRNYFDYGKNVKEIPSHRILAIFRGEEKGKLSVSIRPKKKKAFELLQSLMLKNNSLSSQTVDKAIIDGYKRLLAPSLETETRNWLKERADREAIQVFATNLEHLLMAPPLGRKRVMGVDPGFKSGCKVVCLDSQGNLEENTVIYPHPPQQKIEEARNTIQSLVDEYKIEAIAIGSGTAGRETENFVRNVDLPSSIIVARVNEDGASIYSTSEIARKEFPNYDATVRGAVSIARRLADPLSELVKIDPKSLGVGQYQHDVDQSLLKKKLDQVVESCVNNVGVDLNTASEKLLTYVSGLGPSLARNIVEYRTENGPFTTINELKKVPRIGEKTFQQSAGFLRIEDGNQPLDRTAVHPENYTLIKKIAKNLKCTVQEIIEDDKRRQKIELENYISENVGIPTLEDIIDELEKPGRDPRKGFSVFSFDDRVRTVDDLTEGMVLPGVITNVTKFGAFVDIGLKADGLIHISELSSDFVENPAEEVRLNQQVKVKVLKIEKERKRISLSMDF